MRVLSLFDGISCARVALGDRVTTYYASEVDKYAIAISTKNYPDIVRLGDVRDVKGLTGIDLLIGGSPCQDLSIAKTDRKGLDGDRSGLFWEYVRILREVKPKWFVLENVASMSKTDRDIITREMGVEPVMIDAALVSAQSRKRLFWTNIPVTQPADRGLVLADILQPDSEVDESMVIKQGKAFRVTASYWNGGEGQAEYKHNRVHKARTMVKLGYVGNGDSQTNRVYSPEGKAPTQCKGPGGGALPTLIKVGHIGTSDAQANRVYSPNGKSCTLSANGGGLGAKTGLYETEGKIRKLTPVECERLMGLPDGYTEGVAKTHRYKCIGNAFHVDVIKHILSAFKTDGNLSKE